jgi:alpha-galactosidase
MAAFTNILASYDLGATRLLYLRCPRTGVVEFSCIPISCAHLVVPQREVDRGTHVDHLPARWLPVYAHEPEWLTPCKTTASPFVHEFTMNRSMRSNHDMRGLRFESHSATPTDSGGQLIETEVAAACGLRLIHRVRWEPGERFFRVSVEVRHGGEAPVTIEYLPSFSLGCLTPFDPGQAVERLKLHRFRAVWSAEGRHEARLLEELSLERAWTGYGRRTERFGQCGSLPVRGWFPWAAIEDTEAGVFWGAQLAAPGSWHLEVSRVKDKVTLSGGLPSRDFGEWWLTLPPGESFSTPEATLACVAGDLDDLCQALTDAQRPAAAQHQTAHGPLPVVFNEWCSSWGEPTHEAVTASTDVLGKNGLADIFVIDDGWAHKPAGGDIQNNGDWIVDTVKFPRGLRLTADAIRAAGMVPGLWFEYECATEGTEAFARTALHLRRDGQPIQVGTRHFWDLRKPDTEAVLAEKLIARLREDGFGYLKIDYNESLPAGVDGPYSPGENLRQHLLAVQRFVARIRREVPGVIIENCSSGGHRLEPSFQAACAMGSFSDAHETLSIPIIAANLHRLILPAQMQVWCVMHGDDDQRRIRYGLSAGFLGILALSGSVRDWAPWQLAEIAAARATHRNASDVIRHGHTRIYRDLSPSWNAPRGWQAVVRATADAALVVFHTFAHPLPQTVQVPLPPGAWALAETYGDVEPLRNEARGGAIELATSREFCGGALLLRKTGS